MALSKNKQPLRIEMRKTLSYLIKQNKSIEFVLKMNYGKSQENIKKDDIITFRKKLYILLYFKYNKSKIILPKKPEIVKNALVFTIGLDEKTPLMIVKQIADNMFDYIRLNYKSLNENLKCRTSLKISEFKKFLFFTNEQLFVDTYKSFKLNPDGSSFHCTNDAIGLSDYTVDGRSNTLPTCEFCHLILKRISSNSLKRKRKSDEHKKEANESQDKKEKKKRKKRKKRKSCFI